MDDLNLVPMAGVDNFAGSKVGRTKCASRVQAMEGLNQPVLHKYAVPVPILNFRNNNNIK